MNPKTLKRTFLTPLAFFCVLFLFATQLSAKKIKVGADIWPPFFMVEEGRHYGIAVDIINEVIKQTGHSIEFVTLPNLRARKAFERGDIDLQLLDSPAWNTDKQNSLALYSQEVMQVQEYIYTFNDSKAFINDFSDLSGKRIHIMRGYYYALLENSFSSPPFIVESVNEAPVLLHLLAKKRTDAIFMDSINFTYLASQLGYSTSLFKRSLLLSSSPVAIKVTLKNRDLLVVFNKVIKEMKESGRIDKIVHKYTLQ